MIRTEEFKSKNIKKRQLSYKEAKQKAASYCAYQERCQKEVREKLYTYGLPSDEVEDLLAYLISEGYINEERFARTFAGGKFRLKKWGRNKIINELKIRQISPYCIEKGLSEIEEEEYLSTLASLIEKKTMNFQSDDPLKSKNRIAEFLIRKGYEKVLVWDILNDNFGN